MARRRCTRLTKRSAAPMSVRVPSGSKNSSSRTRRSTWVTPFLGGMNSSTSPVNATRPTRSLCRIAENASSAVSSAATSVLLLAAEPNVPEADRSTTNNTVSSRSSTKRFT